MFKGVSNESPALRGSRRPSVQRLHNLKLLAIVSEEILSDIRIEDAYGESPPPPAFLEAPMWPKAGLELGQAIGPCVPRVGLESLRGTRGGRKRKWRRGRNKEEEEEASWEPLGALLGPPGSFLGASWRPLGGLLGPLGGLWGLLGGLFGRLVAFLARLTPSEAVLGPL